MSAVSTNAQTSLPADPPVRGDIDAPLEIIEFSDFECPFCARALPVIDSLLNRHGDRVRFEFRHYPLPMHEHASRVARAAVEAHRQDAFWEFHDLVFERQARLADADLIAYADTLGLDTGRIREAVDSEQHGSIVQRDIALGRLLAVTGTPTFFLNGYRLSGVPPLWVFELALEASEEGRIEKRPLPIGE